MEFCRTDGKWRPLWRSWDCTALSIPHTCKFDCRLLANMHYHYKQTEAKDDTSNFSHAASYPAPINHPPSHSFAPSCPIGRMGSPSFSPGTGLSSHAWNALLECAALLSTHDLRLLELVLHVHLVAILSADSLLRFEERGREANG
jgi:hypothetical protein